MMSEDNLVFLGIMLCAAGCGVVLFMLMGIAMWWFDRKQKREFALFKKVYSTYEILPPKQLVHGTANFTKFMAKVSDGYAIGVVIPGDDAHSRPTFHTHTYHTFSTWQEADACLQELVAQESTQDDSCSP